MRRGHGESGEEGVEVREGLRDPAEDDRRTVDGPSVVQPTEERILQAALQVLREVGHGGFSVQKVARAAGVYQGNVTYYWPRRRDLERALAVRVVEDYRRTLGPPKVDAAASAEERAEALARLLFADAVSAERVRVLPELWSMANSDANIAGVVTDAYADMEDGALTALGVDPAAPCAADVRHALFLLGVSVQGLTAFCSQRGGDATGLDALIEALVALHVPLVAAALASCDG